MTTLYCGGSFDLFHRGHVELLRHAAEFGRVVAAVNSDAFHESYRGVLPVIPEMDRLAVVLACRYVTNAFLMPSHDAQRNVISAWEPDFIVHGSDWTGDSLLTQLGIDHAFLDEHDITMLYLPYTTGISSTAIRGRLHDRAALP